MRVAQLAVHGLQALQADPLAKGVGRDREQLVQVAQRQPAGAGDGLWRQFGVAQMLLHILLDPRQVQGAEVIAFTAQYSLILLQGQQQRGRSLFQQ
ncbi:hypothetical protein D3C81_1671960 [compost metagenome]